MIPFLLKGLLQFKGNLAPNGAVVERTTMVKEMLKQEQQETLDHEDQPKLLKHESTG